MNGLNLKGGQASTGPHRIDHKYDTNARQRQRRAQHTGSFKSMRQEFGGTTERGGHYWPEGMTRRIARQIARDRV